ncbi:monofunctional biosynthetic peptidoglycan transglycosylase [Paralcaligenes sp. KSB-10]|jgi:monofunctional biosynthetic peptidoglycan transglycosylase|uniref:monofunctional biosynthetic peptidoglycan transglycosylase n=1 Tax=Paralcaligenes sp. KSB-10 TaxID=2901142 RepID=UPI001E36022C|nr:monofunctional biosynthetic peptidoglycan transglycosylase [Paralcaligenes sp. KSB-10]UHL62798.1 monofunctional biosynthetic peptidoglycan transglycosylase [Paralcaligenes sp. KSB-10]
MPARKRTGKKLLGTVLLVGMGAMLLYQFGLFVMIVWFNFRNPDTSAFMTATLTELRSTDPKAALDHQWVPYSQINTSLKRAVIASEDANFTDHDGVEWDAIRKAWQYNLRQAEQGKSKMRGGSTITQQLAKNLFLSSSRSYLRKAQELALAYMIELVMSKERILELYLNIAQWGGNVFGAQAAARHYFHVNAAQLNRYQSAKLAAMLPNPAYYDGHRDTAYLRSRAFTIEKRMRLVDLPDLP